VRGGRRTVRGSVTNAAGGATVFDKPVDNIGDKVFGSTSGYATYANQHVYNVVIPGCSTQGRVFVGQRMEPFYIAVGKAFDLFNLNPLGAEVGGNNNDLEGKNVSTLAMELPISCLTAGTDPVIGAYTTASLRQGRLLDGSPAAGAGQGHAQRWRLDSGVAPGYAAGQRADHRHRRQGQVQRLQAEVDVAKFADDVTNPVLPAPIQTLFPAALAPTNFPRTDLVTAFLKGIKGVNQPTTVVSAEMLRLNTSIAVTAAGAQNPLGVAAGDSAGFPNGRRPASQLRCLAHRRHLRPFNPWRAAAVEPAARPAHPAARCSARTGRCCPAWRGCWRTTDRTTGAPAGRPPSE